MFFQYTIRNASSSAWADVSFFEITGSYSIFELVVSYSLVPILSVTGISGNLISMRILHKHGLRKSSNVIIFALALADTIYLVGINNFAMFIYLHAYWGHLGFFFSEGVARFLYVLFHALVCLETMGKVMSMLLPTLIIAERFVAVFWPLQFSRLLTARRVQVTTAVMYLLAVPPFVLYERFTEFVYFTKNDTNVSVGLIVKSSTFNMDIRGYELMTDVYTIVCGPVSVGIVVMGCVLVGVKVHLQLRRRHKMTSQEVTKPAGYQLRKNILNSFSLGRSHSYQVSNVVHASLNKVGTQETPNQVVSSKTAGQHVQFSDDLASESSTHPHSNTDFRRLSASRHENPFAKPTPQRPQVRTTKILLSVCTVYSVTATLSFLSDLVFNSRNLSYHTAVVVHRCTIVAMCINSSANFVIYVAMNRNFRATYRRMCCRCLVRGTPEELPSRTISKSHV